MAARAAAATAAPPAAVPMDLPSLEEELKKLGISIVSSRQDTVIAIRVKGLAGKALDRGLRLCDQLLQEKLKHVTKSFTDPSTKLFTDPTFGPSAEDVHGATALCKNGSAIPSKGGSQHQMKVLALLKGDKIRWERPEYAADDEEADNQRESSAEGDDDEAEDDSNARAIPQERVFASNARLFSDGVCSGDVIQGNLGDCWFLSALSVVATRSDLLEQTFWRGDKHKQRGLFVCRFMKNFVWHYVVIDDRLPVYGFSKSKEGKPYFARCRDPNELWVALLEKAYAKLHGSYEALIGGYVDVALNDLTGMCSEQVILKPGYPGYGEDPFAPTKALSQQQQRGDPFWEKLLRYKSSGTLMGCSIQPAPASGDKNVAAESSAGNGLYYKHAYALVDAAEVNTATHQRVKLVKLRNPWGMGEWTGPWSDASEERAANQDVIEQFFRVLRRTVGGNASKRVFLSLTGKGELKLDEIAQEEVVDVNTNDGTFFMSYDAWMQYFTHFFAGIDFPDAWHGRRVEGCWNEATCGGNTTKSTWLNNPRFELVVQARSPFFISLSQEDPRGKENLKIVPIGFHVCSLVSSGSKAELKEPAGKADAYYRLYKDKDRTEYQKGIRPEPLPPALIPGSVVPGVDEDGAAQPAYTFKQAVSVDVTLEPGRYCIIPSMYMRTDKDSGKTNVGTFWLSVYSSQLKFTLEGGEKIAEEEEVDETEGDLGNNSPLSSRRRSSTRSWIGGDSPRRRSEVGVSSVDAISLNDQRRRFEDAKEELLAQAKAKGIGLRELKLEFSKAGAIKKLDVRKKMLSVGFKPDDLSDDKINVLFSGLASETANSQATIQAEQILNLFEAEIHEDQMACEIPEIEDDEVPEKLHEEGVLSIELRGARDIPTGRSTINSQQQRAAVRLQAVEFSTNEAHVRKLCALQVSEKNRALAQAIRPVLRRNGWLPGDIKKRMKGASPSTAVANPVTTFYELLEMELQSRAKTRRDTQDETSLSDATPIVSNVAVSTLSQISKPPASVDLSAIHKSARMQSLEAKRSQRLADLQRKKREALGDSSKAASLPRLIGGRKSGSSFVKCSDCDRRVLVTGRATADSDSHPQSYRCTGAQCWSVLCAACHTRLPIGKKVCELCFEHELTPAEAFGSRLRTLLIEKIGTSKDREAKVVQYFKSIDSDKSGALNYDEFASALTAFELQPPLTADQMQSLMRQFDVNKDGEISASEFHDWVFQDQVWSPSSSVQVPSSDDKLGVEAVRELVMSLIHSMVDEAIAADAVSSSVSQWVVTSTSLGSKSIETRVVPDTQYHQQEESGSIFFQRVASLPASGDAAEEGIDDSIDQVFNRYDRDGSGQIDASEFRGLLQALGLSLSDTDAALLMRRVEATASRNDTVDLSEFRGYVERLTLKGNSNISGAEPEASDTLIHKLLALSERAANGKRDEAVEVLQQFHWNMGRSQAAELRYRLKQSVGVSLSVAEIQRIANAFHLREVVPSSVAATPLPPAASDQDKRILDLNNSGDVLVQLLLSSSFASQLKSFSARAVCTQLSDHLTAVTKSTSADGIWRSVFGSTTAPLDQRVFLDRLLASGFSIPTSDASAKDLHRLTTKLLVALTLDALRCDGGISRANDGSSWAVGFNLFTIALHYSRLDAIEAKFTHVLRSYLHTCRGQTSYIFSVAVEPGERLVVRATEPTNKYSMDLVLHSREYDRLAISQLSESIWPRHARRINRHSAFVKSPTALVTSTTHPCLHSGLVSFISRLRVDLGDSISSQHLVTPSLSLVEDPSFLRTLESLLAKAKLPFFWSVTPTQLEFSIDGDYLTQLKPPRSFHQLIADTLGSKPGAKPLQSFLKFTGSSLRVRYEVIGQNAVFDSTWSDLQALLSGHQNTFAVIVLKPQGDCFTTKVDRSGGNGAPSWRFRELVTLREPECTDHRLDLPVVYTDTVRVSAIPDGRTSQRITFSPVNSRPSSGAGGASHFVVLSVRRAQPQKHGDKPRLYCTAYDPFTACDFAVEGAPENWPPDFFSASVNQDYEAQWLKMVEEKLFLGTTLTPQLLIQVFSKHPKVDRLLGECQVSVSAAIAHEGHIFDDWFPLLHPIESGRTTGAVNVAFHFNAKKEDKTSGIPNGKVTVLASSTAASKESEQRGATTPPAAVDTGSSKRVSDLERALAEAEKAKQEAVEQAKRLQAQLMAAPVSSSVSEDSQTEIARWKNKLEQVRREQETQQSDQAKRIIALQQELRRAEEDRQRASESEADSRRRSVAAVLPTNLREAALGDDSSAHDILSAMNDILTHRSPSRPYNGLKKAMVAVAEQPGKLSIAAFDDVLDDFGLGFAASSRQRKTLLNVLDPESRGRISIEDFFIKLCGDMELNPPLPVVKQPPPPMAAAPAPLPAEPPLPVPASPPRPVTSHSTLPAPTRPQKMSWKEMKKFLVLNLPDGWETRFTDKGRPYFCNHANRSTQWKHPVPEVEVKYKEWLEENGANFQRASTHTMPTTGRK